MVTQPSVTAAEGRQPRNTLWIVAIVVAAIAIVAIVMGTMSIFDDDDVLTSADNGSEIRMQPDDEIQINLDSNATTGYEWEIDALDESIVQSLGSTYVSPENGAVGEGGHEEWRFRAIDAGSTTLVLKYWRPWEGDASIVDRIQISIVVGD